MINLITRFRETIKLGDKIHELFGGELPDYITHRATHDILDIMGFPKDNSLELYNYKEGKPYPGYTMDDIFSRDSLVDIFYEIEDPEDIFNTLLKERNIYITNGGKIGS